MYVAYYTLVLISILIVDPADVVLLFRGVITQKISYQSVLGGVWLQTRETRILNIRYVNNFQAVFV